MAVETVGYNLELWKCFAGYVDDPAPQSPTWTADARASYSLADGDPGEEGNITRYLSCNTVRSLANNFKGVSCWWLLKNLDQEK